MIDDATGVFLPSTGEPEYRNPSAAIAAPNSKRRRADGGERNDSDDKEDARCPSDFTPDYSFATEDMRRAQRVPQIAFVSGPIVEDEDMRRERAAAELRASRAR